MRLAVALMLFSISAHAATWYADLNGVSTNGSYAAPWSVDYAVGRTGIVNPYLAPGDTVLFKPGGPYVCADYFSGYDGTNRLGFAISGTAANKITYRSLYPWKFIFNGNLFLPPTSSNIVLEGFRIYSTDTFDRNRYGAVSPDTNLNTRPYTHPVAIEEFGPGNQLLHNLCENCGHPGIASWNGTMGKYIAGNIIRFTGYNDFTGDPSIGVTNWNGAKRGSGMYMQNLDNTARAMIQGNIIYFTYTEGIYQHCNNSNLWDFYDLNNIVSPQTYGIFYDVHDPNSHGFNVISNYVWANTIKSSTSLGLGTDRSHGGGGTNTFVLDNYLVSGNLNIQAVDGWTELTVTNNTVVMLWDTNYVSTPWIPLIWQLGGSQNTNDWVHSYTFDYNTYWDRTNTIYPPFMYFQTNVLITTNFAGWQAYNGEAHSTYNQSALPTSLVSYVFRPSTDTNYLHVAVFNWPSNSTTTVDISPYVATGTRLTIYDAQNLPAYWTNFTYSGGSVTLDLTLTNIATMWGVFTNPPVTWSGFDPRLRAFVMYQGDPEQPPFIRIVP